MLSQLVPFLLFIWALFQPFFASSTFLILVTLFEGWLFIGHRARPSEAESLSTWNPIEAEVIRKYHLRFRFPLMSQKYSSLLSEVGLLAYFWVPWLLWNEAWIMAVLVGLNARFIASPLSVVLNPVVFLEGAAAKGERWAAEELSVINDIFTRLRAESRKRFTQSRESCRR